MIRSQAVGTQMPYNEPDKYPYLVISDLTGTVYLVANATKLIVMVPGKDIVHKVGDVMTMSEASPCFKKFGGKVELWNA